MIFYSIPDDKSNQYFRMGQVYSFNRLVITLSRPRLCCRHSYRATRTSIVMGTPAAFTVASKIVM
jgi:hypothetical protein